MVKSTTLAENEYETFSLLRKLGFGEDEAIQIADEIYALTGFVINTYFKRLSNPRRNRIIKS